MYWPVEAPQAKSGSKLPRECQIFSIYFSPWCMLHSPRLSHMKVSIPCTCRNILFTGMPAVDFTRDAEESGTQPETGVSWILFRSTANTKRPLEHGFPIIPTGTRDADQHFLPVAYAIASHESQEMFERMWWPVLASA